MQSLIADMELGGGLKLGKVGNHKFWLLHGVLQILEAHNLGLLHLITKEFAENFYGQESSERIRSPRSEVLFADYQIVISLVWPKERFMI